MIFSTEGHPNIAFQKANSRAKRNSNEGVDHLFGADPLKFSESGKDISDLGAEGKAKAKFKVRIDSLSSTNHARAMYIGIGLTRALEAEMRPGEHEGVLEKGSGIWYLNLGNGSICSDCQYMLRYLPEECLPVKVGDLVEVEVELTRAPTSQCPTGSVITELYYIYNNVRLPRAAIFTVAEAELQNLRPYIMLGYQEQSVTLL